MHTTDLELRRLVTLIQTFAQAGRWDAVPHLVQRGLAEHRESADLQLRRLCLFAAQWYLQAAIDLKSMRSALAEAKDVVGSDLDKALNLQIGMTYILLGHPSSAGYVQVAAWLRSEDVARPDLALLVLDQAGRWDPMNAVVPVVQAASHLDLGNLTDAEDCRERAVALGANRDSVASLELRIRSMIGEVIEPSQWDSLEFGPAGHRQQGHATVEVLMQDGRLADALDLAARLDAERSTIRTRHYIRQIRARLADMPDAG